MSDDPPPTAKLEKQLRVLQRKLERSEWHRVDLENQHDRDQHLYRRLQADLEAAKREAEIEAALERIRAQSLRMQYSSELVATSAVFHEQLRALDVPTEFSYVWLPDEAAGKHQFWATWTDEEDGGPVHRSRAVTYALDRTEPYTAACFAAWESDERLFVDFIPPADVEGFFAAWPDVFDDAKHMRPEHFADGIYYAEAYMRYGCFGMNLRRQPTEEERDVLQRFAVEFERAYTRFLDLRRAEAQAREAEIEAALERVRARTMAMRSSAELQETSALLFAQIKELGIETWTSGFNIWEDDERACIGYNATPAGGIGVPIRLPLTEDPFFQTIHEAKKRGDDFLVFESEGESLAQTYRYMFTLPVVEDVMQGIVDSGFDLPEYQVTHCGFFSHGHLMFITLEPCPRAWDVFKRFTKVFEQTYTRFLDLQQAEAQAREAQIEAALERVRSRTMAMHEPDELQAVVSVVAEELQRLDVIMDAGGVIICTYFPDSKDVVHWLSAPDFSSSKPYLLPYFDHPIFNAAWDSREREDDFFSQAFSVDEKDSFFRHAFEHSDYGHFPDDFKEWILVAEHHALTFAWSKNSALLIPSFTDIVPSEADKAILKRFARVFEQAYTRYLDLREAEARSREAQIEAALERLRSRTMAMQSSDELADVVARIFDELTGLDFDLTRCVIWVIEPETRNARFWMANPEHPDSPESYLIPYHDHPSYLAFLDAWDRQERAWVYELGGDLKTTWDEVLFTETELARLPPDVKAGMRAPDRVVLTASFTSFGAFHAAGLEPLSDESTAILRRFATVFDQTYTRFLDLKQAEEQAREARIEVAMERVRSRALAMTASDELLEVVFKIHREFAGLGLPCEQFWQTRYTPDVYEKALTGVGGEKLAAIMELPRDFSSNPALAEWERGEEKIGVFPFDADAACTYLDHMITKGRFHEVDPEGITEEMVREHGGFTFVQARTSHGEIGYTLWGETEPTEEAKDVLARFTSAFDLAYRRFEDLQQAERQAALDRVRAEVASMLRSDAQVTGATFAPLAAEIRTLFGRSDLRLGLATLQTDGTLNVRSGRPLWNSLVVVDALREGTLDWRGTLYETAMHSSEPLLVGDVDHDGSLHEALRGVLREQRVCSLALQPLRTADRTVGLLELSAPEAGAVGPSTLLTMRGLESTFALAVTQNLEGFETRVESAIQQAYTAIHPSVRWRFREAAIERLERGEETAEPEPVVFESVYPLYGAADIRSSTHHRNEAVRHDVLARLGRARDALAAIHDVLPLTILDELGLRVRKRMEQYESVWNAGDEATAERFLGQEVEPVLERMTAGRADLVEILEAHRRSDGTCTPLRSDAYEASRRAINRAVSDVLLAEEREAQRLFPHYLELTRTDGVEHTIYIGPSITPDRPFDRAYVENLRLRQLLTACAIAREVRRLGETLPMPLAIAQLVVVQHDPITLRFRADEKRFDVDSPSGVRFELLKKRLDKACVRGSDERITQPDRIAVVYSTDAEESEYRRYADYLAAQGHIEPDPERLDVEDLPGAAGLKTLRLKVSSSS